MKDLTLITLGFVLLAIGIVGMPLGIAFLLVLVNPLVSFWVVFWVLLGLEVVIGLSGTLFDRN